MIGDFSIGSLEYHPIKPTQELSSRKNHAAWTTNQQNGSISTVEMNLVKIHLENSAPALIQLSVAHIARKLWKITTSDPENLQTL